MKITRAVNPEFIKVLEPMLLPDIDGGTAERYVQVIQGLMRQDPDQVQILIALQEGVESNDIKDHVVAYAISVSPDDLDYTLISQMWSKAGNQKATDSIFQRIVQWSQLKGKSELRIETARDAAAVSRRWGFSVISQTMTLKLDLDFEAAIMEALRKQVVDGQGQQTQEREHADQGAEGSGDESGELVTAADRKGGDPLRRDDRTGVRPAVSDVRGDDPTADSTEQAVGSDDGAGNSHPPQR